LYKKTIDQALLQLKFVLPIGGTLLDSVAYGWLFAQQSELRDLAVSPLPSWPTVPALMSISQSTHILQLHAAAVVAYAVSRLDGIYLIAPTCPFSGYLYD
jgi:hypothetical protein